MSPPERRFPVEIEQAAARWVLRCDRGLAAAEQDEYSQWLAADPRHREAVAEQRWSWDELDRLAGLQTSVRAVPDPDLLAPRSRRGAARWIPLALAAAVAAAAGLFLARRGAAPPPSSYSLTAPCERRVLEDGSVIDLNRGAAIEAAFTAATRRVRLTRGEANFTVAKNPSRPFVVEAAGVEVQAVGTVFNVRLDRAAVDVVVSEGTVKLKDPASGSAERPLVHAGQHAVVPLGRDAPGPRVASVTPESMARLLAWQPRWLDFDDRPLPDIVQAFNAHNSVQLRLGDPALDRVRLSVRFRSDNVEGFVRLMKDDFGMHAERLTDAEMVLQPNR